MLIENKNKHIVYNAILETKIEKSNTKKNRLKIVQDNIGAIFVNMSQPSFQKGGIVIIIASYILKMKLMIKRKEVRFKILMLGAKSKGFKRTNMLWVIIKMITMKNVSIFYRAMVKILGLQKEIHLLDYVDNTEEYLERSKFYIRASITGDSWGRDVIEAMNMGKICLVAGKSPFIENMSSGYFFSPTNPFMLASIMERCIELKDRNTVR